MVRTSILQAFFGSCILFAFFHATRLYSNFLYYIYIDNIFDTPTLPQIFVRIIKSLGTHTSPSQDFIKLHGMSNGINPLYFASSRKGFGVHPSTNLPSHIISLNNLW